MPMGRYRKPVRKIEVGTIVISPTMANTLLDLKHGSEPYYPNRTLRALWDRHLVYPEADRGGRFKLSDLGEEVATALKSRYGRKV